MKIHSKLLKNQTIDIQISDWHAHGFGIARIGSFPIWIPDAIPGEYGQIKIVKVFSTHAFGKWVTRLFDSPNRIPPVCVLSSRCGGCQLFHLTPSQIPYFRTTCLEHLLHTNGIVFPNIQYFEPPSHTAFRNQGRFSFGFNAYESLIIGLFGLGNNQIVDCQNTCIIQHPLTNTVLQCVRNIHAQISVLPHLSGIMTRVSFAKDQMMVNFQGDDLPEPLKQVLIRELQHIPQVSGILFNHQLLVGSDTLTEQIGKFTFQYDSQSFFQSNVKQTERLVERICFHAGHSSGQVVDLFCGVGLFSISLASQAHHIMGIELNERAIQFARENAHHNHCVNTTFYSADACQYPQFISGPIDVMVVDPPRTGLSDSLRHLLKQSPPKRLIYISCNPQSLARDLADLCQAKYTLVGLEIIDMFAGSYHSETLAILISSA